MFIDLNLSYTQVLVVHGLLSKMNTLPFQLYHSDNKMILSFSHYILKIFDKKLRSLEQKPNINSSKKEYKVKLYYHEAMGLLNISLEGMGLLTEFSERNTLQIVINKIDANK
ncbi:hypothetical protein LNJ03_11160 [Tenacibaculum dicentrarchi]|nr:hypothetical protein [Tenacibaculum dicentrarchi]